MIGIVFIGDLYVCPYLKIYTNQLDAMNVPYEVLFWNRSNENLNLPNNYLYYNYASEEEQWIGTKAVDFVKFRLWLRQKLKEKKYDKLIILSTLSGILLADYLKAYKKRYIFDVRDYSYESFAPFYKIEESIIHNSYATTISSPGFRNFLPQYDYVIAHNIQRGELQIPGMQFKKKKHGERLNLVWNGTMRYFSHQKGIINQLANDDRFMIIYHGAGPELEQYEQYCESIHAKNVVFTGRYNNAEKANLLINADIIDNSYWIEKEQEVRYAISNRFYDGLIYRIPQLVEYGTYKTDICTREHIGIGIPKSDSSHFAELLYQWYFSIDEETFNAGCERLLTIVKNDDQFYYDTIERFARM